MKHSEDLKLIGEGYILFVCKELFSLLYLKIYNQFLIYLYSAIIIGALNIRSFFNG